MAGQQQQQGGNNDNSLDFFWGIALVIVAMLAAWYFGRVYIVAAIYKLRYFEILAIDYALQGWAYIAKPLGLPMPSTSSLVDALKIINAGASDDTPFSDIAQVSASVGWFLAFPVALLLVILAYFVYTSNVGGRFKRIHTMKTLKTSEERNWYHISPVKKLDLVNVDIDKGAWAMSLTPMMFAKKHKLLVEDRTKQPVTVTVDRGLASKQFAMQLGPYFSQFETLPAHTQALFAIFAARACRDSKGASNLLNQIARSSETGKPNFSGARELAAKHINSKQVIYVLSRHAYVLTMMASMLELARTDGVMATSEFLWLKPVDRRLWYVLNSVGRQTPFAEVAGPFAHWLVEKKLNRPMRVPMVDEALKALEGAIADIIYEPDDEDGEN
ncbi:MAG: type IVB secretion system coupling complex protein DotM/IcmP [Coxiellaceae bacterium]|nr:type IVB secretion system coupling complex protein DotM/IcmP [Coxiellaceae bacterium]